jgi:endonuclease/exonuclease/phosphatase family metal-dependent hydrolase
LVGVTLLLSYLSTFVSPARIWFLAFFGLAYPYILIVNVCLIIYYVFRKNVKFLLSLTIIVLGLSHLNNFFPIRLSKKFNTGQEKEGRNDIKVLSFNVRSFNILQWYSNPETAKAIINLIQSEHPDVICLQEYYTGSEINYKPETISKLFSNTPFNYIHYSYKNGTNSGYGIATFSKFPIIRKGILSFRNTFNETIYIDIKVNGDTVRIYNNHLQSVRFHRKNYAFLDSLKLKYDEGDLREIKDISLKLKTAFVKRSLQVDSISSHISKCPYPVLVCGDFNDTPVSYTYRKMKKGLKDAFLTSGKGIGSTYSGVFPSFRIDYILYSKEFDPLIFEKVEAELSDHYPILCTLDLKK